MFIYGSSGVGKTSLIRQLMIDLPFPQVVMNCCGYSDSKLFLTHLWGEIRNVLLSFFDSIHFKKSEIHIRSHLNRICNETRPPYRVNELITLIRTSLDFLFQSDESMESQNNQENSEIIKSNKFCFHLLLDKLDCVNDFDSDLLLKLLQLSKVIIIHYIYYNHNIFV